MSHSPAAVRTFVHRYGGTASFVAGFAYDTVTLRRVGQVLDNLVLSGYLLALGLAVVLIGREKAGRTIPDVFARYHASFPAAAQFLVGGLLSAYTVYYARSASLGRTSVFVLLLAGMLVANESLRDRLSNLSLLLSLFYFVTFSFLVFNVPLITGRVDAWTFGLSALLSLVPPAGVAVLVFGWPAPRLSLEARRGALCVGGLFGILVAFYFLNWIPPVPLGLRQVGIYHSVRKEGSAYHATYARPAWYRLWVTSDDPFLARPGDRVYCFASVFSPASLNVDIAHRWQRYDEKRHDWIDAGRVVYRVSGGRDLGYRGYTVKQAVLPGEWRVSVETAAGWSLGQIRFRVVQAPADSLSFVEVAM